MKLFVGLGNPGPKYSQNRHNIGFMALDLIASDHGFAPWRSKFQGMVTEGMLGGEKTILLKPETFMNLSGQSVGEAARFYKIAPTNIWVFHDEIDLAAGKLKAKQGGGHAGHNGLRSLHAHITDVYGRIRMGVGHPGHKDAVPGFVLRDFPKADADWLDDMLRGCSDGAPHLAKGDSAKFMNAVALRLNPPRSGTGTKASDKQRDKQSGKQSANQGAKSAPKPQAAAKPLPSEAPSPAPAAARNPLQKLMDKFK